MAVSGNIHIETEISTLDEPISDTLKRDARAVLSKFLHVLIPRRNKLLLQDWDLWGPLVLTVTLALLLRSSAHEDQKTEVFSGVFFIIWAGSTIVTFNTSLLGGTLSFFQSVCVLGYCILPLVISCVFLRIAALFTQRLWFRMIIIGVALGWSIMASYGFVSGSSPSSRKALIVYPIVLFYIVIAWLIVNDS